MKNLRALSAGLGVLAVAGMGGVVATTGGSASATAPQVVITPADGDMTLGETVTSESGATTSTTVPSFRPTITASIPPPP